MAPEAGKFRPGIWLVLRETGIATVRLALSALALSLERARVMLAEQLYRTFALLSGSPYPK